MMTSDYFLIFLGVVVAFLPLWLPALLYLCSKAITIGILRGRKKFNRDSHKN